jgi:hypothetical protein
MMEQTCEVGRDVDVVAVEAAAELSAVERLQQIDS